jgi:hypothetical protein
MCLLTLTITLCLSVFSQNNKQNEHQNEKQLKILNNKAVERNDQKKPHFNQQLFYNLCIL